MYLSSIFKITNLKLYALEIYVRISAQHVRKKLTERPKTHIEFLVGITLFSLTSCLIISNY